MRKELTETSHEQKPETIDIPVWWVTGGGSMLRRDCLPEDHIESTYNYVKRTYKVDPEDYGIYLDTSEYDELNEKSKQELIKEVIQLRKELRTGMESGF